MNTVPSTEKKSFFRQMQATLLLILVCCIVYLTKQKDYSLTCSYDNIFVNGKWWSVFTALFMHASAGHLLGNMLFLFLFGRAIENRTGSFLLLVIFLAGGAISMFISVFYYPHNEPSLGASGAISCILATLMLFDPWRFSLLLNLLPMPVGVAGFTFLLLNIGGFIRDNNSTIIGSSHTSYLGHLTGFVAGIFFGMILSPDWKKNLFLSIIQFIVYYLLLLLIISYFRR